ncbi:outer membrane beta-barrel protein [Sphingobacterium faecale]|uniref:Outer membrane beta-barrel protein n=1 Tax=Sphingobacterium faecale TaxID=2803775 RepID=A0ABS1QZZ0_9SPHI|nr:outer membrane beta-barrel protein [Sphingobacterium faecale]MBL1408002.1 outer membrane beta-barrel protein [Sphingobacterium faecale]
MIKGILTFITIVVFTSVAFGQEHNWAFGFYGDVNVKAARENSFGVQAKYDLNNRSALQAQVHGRSSFVSVGADYLFSFLNKRNSDFNVFLGVGVAEEFVRFQKEEEIDYELVKDDLFVLNGQLGVSYYFSPVKLSVYGGYKVKYITTDEKFKPNYVTLGVRYHLW